MYDVLRMQVRCSPVLLYRQPCMEKRHVYKFDVPSGGTMPPGSVGEVRQVASRSLSHRHWFTTQALLFEDLRVETFYVTLPPRTSPGPVNAKTRRKQWGRQRATALLALRERAVRMFV